MEDFQVNYNIMDTNNETFFPVNNMLSEEHKNILQSKYGINPEGIQNLKSLKVDEARKLFQRTDINSGGLLIRYPNNPNIYTLRLDTPLLDENGKGLKYIKPSGSKNCTYIPESVNLSSNLIIITEGELKAACAAQRGLPVIGLSGIWNWRQGDKNADYKLPDDMAIIPELKRDWSGQKIVLIYDSDINQEHKAWDAFGRLAEVLYSMGADEVKIISLPQINDDGKTGLDDYITAKEKAGTNPVNILEQLIEATPIWLPMGDGVEKFSSKHLTDSSEKEKIQAVAALLAYSETVAYSRVKEIVKGKDLQQALIKEAKGYLQEAKKRQENRSKDRPGIIDNPIYEKWQERLKRTKYSLDNYGNLCKTHTSIEGNTEIVQKIPLANFIACPTREICRDDGQEKIITLEISGILAGGISLPTINIPISDFPSLNWTSEKWGLKANIEPGIRNKDMVRHAIQSLGFEIPRETVYTHLGWRHTNAKWNYLHANGAVGNSDISVDVSEGNLGLYYFPEKNEHEHKDEDYIHPIRYSLEMLNLAQGEVTFPLLGYTFLAPLCEPLRQADCEPAFVLWTTGESGARKTSLVSAALSHFGRFISGKHPPASFKDTSNNIEKRSFLCKDSVLLVDDYHPSSNTADAKKMKALAQQILRAYGDRIGRNRMRADTSLRAGFAPRGLCMVTGEDVPDAGQSTMARCTVLELKKGDVDLELLSVIQDNSEQLGHSMRGYIEWLAPQMDELPNKLKNTFRELRQKAAIHAQDHGRVPEMVAWLYIGFSYFLEYAYSIGEIDDDKKKNLSETSWKIFLKIANEHSSRISQESPTLRFLDILNELFTTGAISVISLENDIQDEIDDSNTQKTEGFIGWKDKNWYYLIPSITYGIIAQFYQKQGIHFPFTEKTLFKHLANEGYIQTENTSQGTRYTVQKTINKNKKRLIKLKAEAVEGTRKE